MTTTPEGGADPHRDDWKPVPLREKVYDRETKTYYIEFEAPKQLLLNPQYQAMVHDELLRNADRDGLIIEGQIVITERDKNAEPTKSADPTVEGDAKTREVLLDPSKEAEVAAEQDAIESPYKMSKAELEYRQRMRQNLRDTAQEAFGFVAGSLDGTPLPEGRQMRVDRDAFLEGFFGSPVAPPPKREVIIVRAEAMVAMDTGVLSSTLPEHTHVFGTDPSPTDTCRVDGCGEKFGTVPPEPVDIEQEIANFEIPDDLSGLDE